MRDSGSEQVTANTGEGPRILRDQYRVRYLKLIAVFKLLKGLFLLSLGISLIFLNSRTRWMDSISDWATDEMLVVHNKTLHYLLNQLQNMMAGQHLRATGLLSLFYSGILFTEGVGVYLQKRWGEWLMIVATSALIPLELHHLFVKPGAGAVVILLVNCFIVWFLYRVLRWEPSHRHTVAPREMASAS